MKFRIDELHLTFKKEQETIRFNDFNYFYGQMGAGKSTIARLIDFCLGGSLPSREMTPALQTEFVSVGLNLTIEESELQLRRNAGSNQLRASWTHEDELVQVMIPARSAGEEVIPDSGIEVLSDLIYVLSGRTPPKVRKGKIKEDSELSRLSLRDLLWFCYLDQDSLDSTFFNLDHNANAFKKYKSRDVLRFVVGFYQESVSELEVQLEQCRQARLECEAGASAMHEALKDTDVESRQELETLKSEIKSEISILESDIKTIRTQLEEYRPHSAEVLRAKARNISHDVAKLDDATKEVKAFIVNDKEHRNELLSLSTRFRRSQSARAVLGGVKYEDCPSCGNELPDREEKLCVICGQLHDHASTGGLDETAAERDLDDRVKELDTLLLRHHVALKEIQKRLKLKKREKELVDVELNKVSSQYDSQYLSLALTQEKDMAALIQQSVDLERLESLFDKISDLKDRAAKYLVREEIIFSELKKAREKAEKDTQNLDRLKEIFLDCLVRARLQGFYEDDTVTMEAPYFLPEIQSAGTGNLAVTSFTNLGSGGKKTLFKCCFAVAVHRLAVELDALLPSLLIIDSPMKNISERENRDTFEGFHQLLYELSENELKNTQIIMIDKELAPPPEDFSQTFFVRHMQPNTRDTSPSENAFPPLIRYYQDK